ncbi:MAG: 4-hydroxythreonine-4-phosphate dehydrogenase PdxA [Pseudomonadota bacterium]
MKPIAVTMGEPAGIGGEVTIEAWHRRFDEGLSPFFLIDDPACLQKIDPSLKIQEISAPEEALAVFEDALPVLPLKLEATAVAGELNPKNGKAVLQSIEMAVQFALEEKVLAIVTNPIHKEALYSIGFNFPGHTEFLGSLCNADDAPFMMLMCDQLKVVPLTIHIPLKDVASSISTDAIVETAMRIHASMQQDFAFHSPRLAIAGLNPHAGEGGSIGTEDQEIIVPAVDVLKAKGINVIGPLSADTMFHAEARANYDVALCMYHDQALIPIKTLDFHRGVNITLGLPIVRTSPDHGTALNIAGRDMANASSMIESIKLATKIARNRGLFAEESHRKVAGGRG